MPSPDTILAASSPPITPGTLRAILRLSGPNAWQLATSITTPLPNPTPGAHKIRLLDPDLPALLLLFKSPRSFTGEDIAELHLPASPALLRLLTDRLLSPSDSALSPARPANPGEFSARAFFNSKIDLTAAEGIAATIAATNHTQLRAAASLRDGHLHQDISQLAHSLAHLLALVEAGIDFTDEEDVSFIDTKTLTNGLAQLLASLAHRLTHALRIDHLSSPPTVAFIGLPNVGKSSLINALSQSNRSIVSPIAGTTRDALSVLMSSPRGPIRLLDVPGEESLTDELREKMMATRTAALLEADLIIDVKTHPTHLAAWPIIKETRFNAPFLHVQNKIDLLPASAFPEVNKVPPHQIVSAKTGQNIPALRAAIINLVTRQESTSENRLVLNHRHRVLLFDTQSALIRATQLLSTSAHQSHPELLASELRTALDHLGSITGTISPDEVLGKIFSSFCIGK